MEAWELLEKYLTEQTCANELGLHDYSLNGSTIKCIFSYSDEYGEKYYDQRKEIELIEYMTWIYNLCNNK